MRAIVLFGRVDHSAFLGEAADEAGSVFLVGAVNQLLEVVDLIHAVVTGVDGGVSLDRRLVKVELDGAVLIGVPASVLVQHICLPGKAHGSQPIVLGDDQIARMQEVHQPEVHTVRPGGNRNGVRILIPEHMGAVTQNGA